MYYNQIKSSLSLKDCLQSNTKLDNLMNVVMQLKKVCNHPDLFEK